MNSSPASSPAAGGRSASPTGRLSPNSKMPERNSESLGSVKKKAVSFRASTASSPAIKGVQTKLEDSLSTLFATLVTPTKQGILSDLDALLAENSPMLFGSDPVSPFRKESMNTPTTDRNMAQILKKIEDLHEQLQSKEVQLKRQLQENLQTQLKLSQSQDRETVLNLEVAELKQQSQASELEIKDLKESHREELAELSAKHAQQMKASSSLSEGEKEQLQVAHQRLLEQVKAEHQGTLGVVVGRAGEVLQKYQRRAADLKKSQADKETLTHKLTTANLEIARLKASIAQINQQLGAESVEVRSTSLNSAFDNVASIPPKVSPGSGEFTQVQVTALPTSEINLTSSSSSNPTSQPERAASPSQPVSESSATAITLDGEAYSKLSATQKEQLVAFAQELAQGKYPNLEGALERLDAIIPQTLEARAPRSAFTEAHFGDRE